MDQPERVAQPTTALNQATMKLARLLAAVGLIITLISLLGRSYWVFDLFAQFKVQWSVGLLIAGFCLALFRQKGWVLACLVASAINAAPIVPYFLPSGPSVSASRANGPDSGQDLHWSAKSIRLLSLNVLTSNRRFEDVLSLIESKDADLVVLLEVDQAWETALQPLFSQYPHRHLEARADNFGIAFLSKHAWSDLAVFNSKHLQLPSIDVRFAHHDPEFADGIAEGRNSRRPLRIIATHPIPPISRSHWHARNQQLISSAERLDTASANIMVGDFNLTPWSPFFADVLKTGGLRDSALGFGVDPTWYLLPTWMGGLKIDHALIGPGVQATHYQICPDVGSDHRALVVDFQLE